MKQLFFSAFFFLPLIISCNGIALDSLSCASDSISAQPVNERYAQSNESRIVLDTLAGNIIVQRLDSIYIFQEDMLFTEKSISILTSPFEKAAIRTAPQYYWPKGEVYYKYSLNLPDTTEIRRAMDIIQNLSSITFKQAGPNDQDYILYQYNNFNDSFVGKAGGVQILNIYNYDMYGIVMHEIMHALGFFHEHSRSDRDNHIIVNWSNIKDTKKPNFYKYTANTGIDIGPFDFNSIMLYDSMSSDPDFVYDTNIPTMTKLDGSTFVGQRYGLSVGDLNCIASIYGPPYHRLESHIDEVVENTVSGTTEKLVTDNTDSIIFYANRDCTVRQTLAYPRYIMIETTVTTNVGTHYSHNTSRSTICVPAGVSAISIDRWRETEWYEYSNPHEIYIRRNQIINSHLNPIYYGTI